MVNKKKTGRPRKKSAVPIPVAPGAPVEPSLDVRLANAYREYNRAVAEKDLNPSRQAIDDFHRADQLLRYLQKEQRERGPITKPVMSRQR